MLGIDQTSSDTTGVQYDSMIVAAHEKCVRLLQYFKRCPSSCLGDNGFVQGWCRDSCFGGCASVLGPLSPTTLPWESCWGEPFWPRLQNGWGHDPQIALSCDKSSF